MVFCVTAGLTAPGVVEASGSELCARAPLADTVNRTKIGAAPTTSPRALYRRRNRGLRAGDADFLGSGCRGPPHNAECGSRSPYAMPTQSGGSLPSASPRTGGTCHGTGTLVDVDHHQVFPRECFQISAPEVRTPWTGPSSSALRSARPGRRLTTRTAPTCRRRPFDCGSTQVLLDLSRPAQRRDRAAAVCSLRSDPEDILISYGMSLK